MTEEPIDIGLDWQPLSPDEMKLVLEQADVFGAGFPDRPGVGNIFSIIAGAAIYAMYARTSGELIARAHGDETAPFDHQIDDIGVAMAHIMPLVEDPSLSIAVRDLWNSILRSLSGAVRSRQARR